MKTDETMSGMQAGFDKLAESFDKAEREAENATNAFIKFSKAYRRYNNRYNRFVRWVMRQTNKLIIWGTK
jgi:soluble cytochrome b562